MRSVVVTTALLAVPAAAALSQGTWVGPQPPCDIGAGHFRVNSAIVTLRTAVERPMQRARMLAQTLDVLTRTIAQDQQDKNPAAWYYLGRYYVERGDAAGADSAFDRTERLAPRCAADVAAYRRQVWASAFNEGVRTWQEGKQDSAVTLLRLAADLLPADPRAYLTLGRVFAARDQRDTAVQYLRRSVDVAGTDTAFLRERRDALHEIARIEVYRAQSTPAFEQWQRVRFTRDSLERMIANDSIIMGRIVESAAGRRARGTHLAPDDQAIFRRDSTARALALSRGRDARVALARRAMADSAALAAAFRPAVEAYHAVLAADPAALGSRTTLALLYGQTGRPAEAAALFEQLPGAGTTVAAELFEAGRRLAGANVLGAAARAYTLGLEQSPYHRDALLELTNVYVGLRNSTRALATGRRLMEIDPLNRTALRLMAAVWELERVPDSTVTYLTLADSTLTVDVAVTTFHTENGHATLAGTANNIAPRPSSPFRLTLELLDARGVVQASQTVEIPAIPAAGSHPFEVRVTGQSISGWRYRRS